MEIEYPYKVKYYSNDRSFMLEKKEYLGKADNSGIERNQYKYHTLFDGRSQEMKDRIENATGRVAIRGAEGLDFKAEDDQDAIRGIVEFVFEYPGKLGIK